MEKLVRFLLLFVVAELAQMGTSFGQLLQGGAESGGLPALAAFSHTPASVNPASFGVTKKMTVSVWTARLYQIPDLRVSGISSGLVMRRIGIGIRMFRFGFDRYAEDRLDIQFGWSLTRSGFHAPRVGMGLKIIRNTSSKSTRDLSLTWISGLLLPVPPFAQIGIVLQSSAVSSTSRNTTGVRSILMGVGFNLSTRLAIYTDVYLERYFPVSYRSGFEATVVNFLVIRGGFSTDPDLLVFGLSLPIKHFNIHFAFVRHSLLSWSTAVEVAFVL